MNDNTRAEVEELARLLYEAACEFESDEYPDDMRREDWSELGASQGYYFAEVRALLASDWLAEHDRQVAETAFHEGSIATHKVLGDRFIWFAPDNPYRPEAQA